MADSQGDKNDIFCFEQRDFCEEEMKKIFSTTGKMQIYFNTDHLLYEVGRR